MLEAGHVRLEAPDRVVKRDEDGHLYQKRQEAAERVDVPLLVELGELLLLLLAVVSVPAPDTLQLRPELLHGAHAPYLLQRQREEGGPHRERQEDDGEPPRGTERVEEVQ